MPEDSRASERSCDTGEATFPRVMGSFRAVTVEGASSVSGTCAKAIIMVKRNVLILRLQRSAIMGN